MGIDRRFDNDGKHLVSVSFVTRHSRFLSAGIYAICALIPIASGLVGASPVVRTRFLGDDLETWTAFNRGDYPRSFQQSLTFAGIDKWRPLNSLAMQPILRLFGDDYRSYWYFTWLLLLLLGAVVFVAMELLFRPKLRWSILGVSLGISAIIASPLAFMARSGIYGFLEIAPVTLCVLSYLFFDHASNVRSRLPIIYSSLLALSAGLVHERFFIFSVAMSLISASRGRQLSQYRGMWLAFFFNVFFYIYTSVVVLGVNVLKGGGADSFEETKGWWIIVHLLFSVLHLFGGARAETTFFESEAPRALYQGLALRDEYNLLMPFIFLVVLATLFTYACFLKRFRNQNLITGSNLSNSTTNTQRRKLIELAWISIWMLVPAATVNSRIESRWLFASWTFAVMVIIATSFHPDRVVRFFGYGLLVLMLSVSLTGKSSFNEYDWWRIRTNQVLKTIERLAPKAGYWEVAIVVPNYPDENNSVVWWGLNYGRALTEYLDNAPNGIYFGRSDVMKFCKRPCLELVVVDDPSKGQEVDQAKNQMISFRWLD